MAAHLEVRAKDVAAARKVFGRGIGVAPKEKLFKGYIELELQLGVCLRVLVAVRCVPARACCCTRACDDSTEQRAARVGKKLADER